MSRRVFLDLDGVLVDFVTGMCEAHDRENPYLANPCGNYQLEDLWGMTADDFWNPAREEAFWTNLDWMPDGQDIYRLVLGTFPVSEVCILTSGPSPESAAGKVAWIKANLPALKRNYLIGPNKHFCATPGSLLIDDADHNVQPFIDAGGDAVLVPRGWNSDYQLLQHASTFDHLLVRLNDYW